MTDDGLFPPPPRPRHPTPCADSLTLTLADWAERDHLNTPDHAGRRAILQTLAALADAALAASLAGRASQYSAAAVVDRYRAALDSYAPPAVRGIDPAAAQLEAAALAIIDAAP